MLRAICKVFGCRFPSQRMHRFDDRIESDPCLRCKRPVVTKRGAGTHDAGAPGQAMNAGAGRAPRPRGPGARFLRTRRWRLATGRIDGEYYSGHCWLHIGAWQLFLWRREYPNGRGASAPSD